MELVQRVRFHPDPDSVLLVLSREDVRKRLIVPRVRISSVVRLLRSRPFVCCLSIDGVGVRVLLDDEDDAEDRLRDLRKPSPFDFGRCGTAWTLGRGGGREMGLGDGEAGLELPYSLGVDAGVVLPGVVLGSVSLLRLEDPKLLKLELSRTVVESKTAMAGDMLIWVASSPLGMGTSSPVSVTRTARRGSGSGAKRIFLGDSGEWEDGDGALEWWDDAGGGASELDDEGDVELTVRDEDEEAGFWRERIGCWATATDIGCAVCGEE